MFSVCIMYNPNSRLYSYVYFVIPVISFVISSEKYEKYIEIEIESMF